MERMKKWNALTVKLNALVLVIVLVLSLGLAGFAYQTNSDRVDNIYKKNTSRAAATVAAFIDGNKVERLLYALKTKEFNEARNAALDADDDGIVRDWLDQKGLLDLYKQLDKDLGIYREKLEASFVYLQSLEQGISINIVDPDEDIFYMGSLEETPEGFEIYRTNKHIDPMVTNTEFGWLCSAYEPVTNSKGENVAIVGVDINMNDVVAERQKFLTTMILFAVAMMVVSSLVTVLLMNRIGRKTEPADK